MPGPISTHSSFSSFQAQWGDPSTRPDTQGLDHCDVVVRGQSYHIDFGSQEVTHQRDGMSRMDKFCHNLRKVFGDGIFGKTSDHIKSVVFPEVRVDLMNDAFSDLSGGSSVFSVASAAPSTSSSPSLGRQQSTRM